VKLRSKKGHRRRLREMTTTGTMFVGLNSVPAGQHLYTAYLAERVDGGWMPSDEFDFLASRTAGSDALREALAKNPEFADLYDLTSGDLKVVGLVDQSVGEIVFDQTAECRAYGERGM
jgi:hypothetical protein